MVEIKPRYVYVTNRKTKTGGLIRLKLVWIKDAGEYALCSFLSHNYFTVETCEDMIRILKEANKEANDKTNKNKR